MLTIGSNRSLFLIIQISFFSVPRCKQVKVCNEYQGLEGGRRHCGRVIPSSLTTMKNSRPATFELQNPSRGVPEQHRTSQSPDLEALKFWKSRSGLPTTSPPGRGFHQKLTVIPSSSPMHYVSGSTVTAAIACSGNSQCMAARRTCLKKEETTVKTKLASGLVA